MNLAQMSNAILANMQAPGSNFGIGGNPNAQAPNWPVNTQIGQGLVEFQINEGYGQLLQEIEDLELLLITHTFKSLPLTFQYPIVAAGGPICSQVAHCYYQPFGLPYTYEYEKGIRFFGWDDFQRKTGWGYLKPYSYGNQPMYVTVTPDLLNVQWYPGSAIVNDTITLQYTPLPTFGAAGCPTLVAETDVPLLPPDTHWAIVYYALGQLWMRAREFQASLFYYNEDPQHPGAYQNKIKKIRATHTKKSHGDTIHIKPFPVSLGINSFLG